MRHKFKKHPFLGCIFRWGSPCVVSPLGTQQAFLELLRDPAPTFGNTNFSDFWYKILKPSEHIAEYRQYRRNFDNTPQMCKYCHILRGSRANEAQHGEIGLRICATHRNFVWDLYFQNNDISLFFNTNWALYNRHKKKLIFELLPAFTCYLRYARRSEMQARGNRGRPWVLKAPQRRHIAPSSTT